MRPPATRMDPEGAEQVEGNEGTLVGGVKQPTSGYHMGHAAFSSAAVDSARNLQGVLWNGLGPLWEVGESTRKPAAVERGGPPQVTHRSQRRILQKEIPLEVAVFDMVWGSFSVCVWLECAWRVVQKSSSLL